MKRMRLFNLVVVAAALMLQFKVVVAAPLSIVAHQLVPDSSVTMHIYLPETRDPRVGTYYTFAYSSIADKVHFDHCIQLVVVAQSNPAKYFVDLVATPAPPSRYIPGAVYDTGNPYTTGIYGGGCRLINRP